MNPHNKNRLTLAALLLLFAIPLGVAWLLSASGWHPHNTRNSGMLVSPPRDVTGVTAKLADGSTLAWRDPNYRWTLLALPGAQCGTVCRTRLDEALRMRITLGRNAARLRVVYIGPSLPADFVAAHAPLQSATTDPAAFTAERAQGDDSLALALVDPQGLLMLRYADGYSAQGLRSDILKIIY